MKKTLISLSGGMDSLGLLATLHEQDEQHLEAVAFKYPSKHNAWELEAAKHIAGHYSVNFTIVDIASVMAGFTSNLLHSGGPIPEGHYSDESMKATVVPCRNMIFLSILAGLAESRGFDNVAIGIHSGDHAIYPDCRPQFKHAMTTTIWAATDGRVTLLAPFLNETKTSIIKSTMGFETPVPWEMSRTCYKDQEWACGKCGSCVERLEAFANNGLTDPAPYASQKQISFD